MKYLIDTQILVWLIIDTERIPKNIKVVLKKLDNKIFVSSVSIWEIAIKQSVGKLRFPFELKDIVKVINAMNIKILDINSTHLIKVADLQFFHKDPFDRLIISQGIIEKLPIISSDRNFNNYPVTIIW